MKILTQDQTEMYNLNNFKAISIYLDEQWQIRLVSETLNVCVAKYSTEEQAKGVIKAIFESMLDKYLMPQDNMPQEHSEELKE